MSYYNFLVILEGPDGTGKTTLAAELSRRLPAMKVGHGSMPGYVGHDLAQQNFIGMLAPLLGLGSVVMDRCWLSERIYGGVLRGGADRLRPYTRMLQRTALSCDHLLVRCHHDVEKLWETVEARHEVELLKRKADLQRVHDRYEEAGFNTDLFHLPVNPRSMPLTEAADVVHSGLKALYDNNELLTRSAWRAAGLTGSLHRLRRGKGPLKLRPVLLLGDGPTPRSTGVPFVDFSPAGYSSWFANALDEMGVPEIDLVWFNAHDLNGESRELPNELLIDLSTRLRAIVCLGERASRSLKSIASALSCRVFTGEHPQYLRRFHHNRPLADSHLGGCLRAALDLGKEE